MGVAKQVVLTIGFNKGVILQDENREGKHIEGGFGQMPMVRKP
jgi:hypothetical protein